MNIPGNANWRGFQRADYQGPSTTCRKWLANPRVSGIPTTRSDSGETFPSKSDAETSAHVGGTARHGPVARLRVHRRSVAPLCADAGPYNRLPWPVCSMV